VYISVFKCFFHVHLGIKYCLFPSFNLPLFSMKNSDYYSYFYSRSFIVYLTLIWTSPHCCFLFKDVWKILEYFQKDLCLFFLFLVVLGFVFKALHFKTDFLQHSRKPKKCALYLWNLGIKQRTSISALHIISKAYRINFRVFS
jgi:hypothetical protein